jgi:hypothetical protein
LRALRLGRGLATANGGSWAGLGGMYDVRLGMVR